MSTLNPTPNIYDQLLSLPLFQGHSREDLTSILAKIKVDFRQFSEGQTLVHQDQTVEELYFLMEGTVILRRTSFQKDVHFIETLSAPQCFGMQNLFGLNRNYDYTIRALTPVNVFVISKSAFVNHLFQYEVFRYNVLNNLTAQIQRSRKLLWTPIPDSPLQAFIHLLKTHFFYPAGPKEIEGGMVSLGILMNRPRAQVSAILNQLVSKGLITLSRKRIVIPQVQNIITLRDEIE